MFDRFLDHVAHAGAFGRQGAAGFCNDASQDIACLLAFAGECSGDALQTLVENGFQLVGAGVEGFCDLEDLGTERNVDLRNPLRQGIRELLALAGENSTGFRQTVVEGGGHFVLTFDEGLGDFLGARDQRVADLAGTVVERLVNAIGAGHHRGCQVFSLLCHGVGRDIDAFAKGPADFLSTISQCRAGSFNTLAKLDGDGIGAIGENFGDVPGFLFKGLADTRRALLDCIRQKRRAGFQGCLEGGGPLVEGQIKRVDPAAERGIHGVDACRKGVVQRCKA